MVLALLDGRPGERVVPHAHRVHHAEDVLDGGSLTRGVHALQHQQQPAAAAYPSLREQLLLQDR
jgi:hypothetical protein